MSAVENAISAVHATQSILTALTGLALTTHRFPSDTATSSLASSYDFIIVGGGTAGGVLASRLSENENFTVLLVEAGPVTPLECMLPGLFTLQPNLPTDWNLTSIDDGYANQNLQNNYVEMTSGKMLGGSSCLDHLIYVRGNEYDYSGWVNKTGDDSWSYSNLLPYFKMIENTLDENILSEFPTFTSTSGQLKLKTQPSPLNIPILNAFHEQGHKLISSINANVTLGYTEPQLNIADDCRQSTAMAYLSPAKNRPNLHVKYNTQVTKIIFDSDNRATGCIMMDSDGVYTTVNANKEVIISAGAINSAKLLMVSGVGPKEKLESLNISVVSDLPVGETLYDHVVAITSYTLGETTTSTESNPHEFPAPMMTGYVSIDCTSNPTYQTIPLVFTQSSSGLLQLCAHVFKYHKDICQSIYNANVDKEILFSIINLLRPVSSGSVNIVSSDMSVAANISLGHLSNEEDLDTLTYSVMDVNTILNTNYFRSINSTLVALNLTNCQDLDNSTFEYWKCYIKETSSTLWHFTSTCPMGTVLNSDLTVKYTSGLRVIDASAMPYIISGNIKGAVYVIAEKGSAMIKNKYS